MTTHNPKNERIKREYFSYLREAKRQSEASVDAVAAALVRFEQFNRFKDFKAFHHQQATAFKRHLADQQSQTTRGKLSKATQHATLSHLKRFFQWLVSQPGYKSRFTFTDAEYFNLPQKDSRVAMARRQRPAPTVEQVLHVIDQMPTEDEIELRNRALVAFVLLTGARDGAVASLKLKHIDLDAGCVHQDAREVNTKFSKTFTSYFFPVGDQVRNVVENWIDFLRKEKLWGDSDPLFPRTLIGLDNCSRFGAVGLERVHWSNASPIRKIFKDAFVAAGLPYFNPHSFRSTLAKLGERVTRNPEEFKAWSQNLGHDGMLTTFFSYGSVSTDRQGEILSGLAVRPDDTSKRALLKAIERELLA